MYCNEGKLTNATTKIDKPQGAVNAAVLYPVRVVSSPLFFVAGKVQRVVQLSMGYLARIGVFSFGEWNRSWVKKRIIEWYKGGCLDTQRRLTFDPYRLDQAFGTLEAIGGSRFPVFSKDGTKLDTMLIRFADVENRIREMGGQIAKCMPITIEETVQEGKERTYHCKKGHHPSGTNEYVDIILPFGESTKWGNFYNTVLLGLGLEKGEIQMPSGEIVHGLIVKHWNSVNPSRPKPGQCFIRCNAPTESYPMAKRDVLRRLFGTQGDCLLFDYRGTWKSEGVPSEGGYYIDAETMVDKAINEYGYKPGDIWADGFCLGSGVAMHLFRKYHDLGINIFVQNPFDSMLRTFKTQLFPGNILGPLGISEIRSWDPFITQSAKEDCFNSVGKLEGLQGEPKKGTAIIVNTDTDTTVPANAHARLATAMGQVAEKCFTTNYRHPDRNKNGHSADILSDPLLWNKVVSQITEKDYPQRSSWLPFNLGG